MSAQHPYYESEQKLRAREENVKLFRELTGLYSIPSDRQYWTLSALQRTTPTSDINQMLSLGLLQSKAQFFGTDRVEWVIERNRVNHPEATWIVGEWEECITEFEPFVPAVVYLDTESLAGRVALNMAATTMKLCPQGTVLLLNVMQSSRYRSPMETPEFITALSKRVPNLTEWVPEGGVKVYDYCSNSTLMRCFAFYLRGE